MDVLIVMFGSKFCFNFRNILTKQASKLERRRQVYGKGTQAGGGEVIKFSTGGVCAHFEHKPLPTPAIHPKNDVLANAQSR